jgi:hypothetical protein
VAPVRQVNARALLYVAAGVAGIVLAQRIISGATSIGGAVATGARAVGDVLNQVNPLNRDNVINRAANTAWETITGRPGQTIGLSIQELFTRTPASTAYDADADDWQLGQAMRAAEPSYFQRRETIRNAGPWSAVDQEDADMGAAMRGLAIAPIPQPTGAAWPASIPRRP